jgi:hypothetical protein
MDQLPLLPGVQIERKIVSIDDVSDDEDDMGTCAFLFKGAQRKRALEDMQRKKDAALADAAVAARLEAEAAALREEEDDGAGTPSKRICGSLGGVGAAGGQSSAGASAGDVLLNAEDAALLEKDRLQQVRLREMQAALGPDDDVRPPCRHRHSCGVVFRLHPGRHLQLFRLPLSAATRLPPVARQDEEEDYIMSGSSASGGPSRCFNADDAGRGVSRRSTAVAAALTTNPNIWLRVMSEGSADDSMPISFTFVPLPRTRTSLAHPPEHNLPHSPRHRLWTSPARCVH